MVEKLRVMMRAFVVAGLAMTISACGSGGGSGSSVTPPVVTSTAQEDKFGTAFGMDYRAAANNEPANVSDGDIVVVSLTTEPINVN